MHFINGIVKTARNNSEMNLGRNEDAFRRDNRYRFVGSDFRFEREKTVCSFTVCVVVNGKAAARTPSDLREIYYAG
jgi:hypothetical protein